MPARSLGKRLVTLAAAAASVLYSAPVFACTTCYTSALGEKGIHALKSGILILLIPTVTLFGGLLWLTFRYRNSCPSWRRVLGQETLDSTLESGDAELFTPPGNADRAPSHP